MSLHRKDNDGNWKKIWPSVHGPVGTCAWKDSILFFGVDDDQPAGRNWILGDNIYLLYCEGNGPIVDVTKWVVQKIGLPQVSVWKMTQKDDLVTLRFNMDPSGLTFGFEELSKYAVEVEENGIEGRVNRQAVIKPPPTIGAAQQREGESPTN